MTSDVEDPMEAEFGTVAEWTAEVAAQLGPDYFIPAACRGSGQPAALDWLLAGLTRPRAPGWSTSGPASAAPTRSRRPRPASGRCCWSPSTPPAVAAARLFGAPVIQADATALPVADGRADLAWSLGVCARCRAGTPSGRCCGSWAASSAPAGGSACWSTSPSVCRWTTRRRGTISRRGADLDAMVRRAGLEVLGRGGRAPHERGPGRLA